MFGHLPDELINKILSYNYVKPTYLMEMKLVGKLLNKHDQLVIMESDPTIDDIDDQMDDFEHFLDYLPKYTHLFFLMKLYTDSYVDLYDPLYIKERREYSVDRRNYVWQQDDPIAKLIEVFQIRFMT